MTDVSFRFTRLSFSVRIERDRRIRFILPILLELNFHFGQRIPEPDDLLGVLWQQKLPLANWVMAYRTSMFHPKATLKMPLRTEAGSLSMCIRVGMALLQSA